MAEARPSRRPGRRSRGRRALFVAGALVLLAGVAAAWWFVWGRSTAPLPQPDTTTTAGLSPRYLGSFGDSGPQRLVEPLGVAASGERVYVADAGARSVAVFDRTGTRVATLSGGGLKVPAYVAVDPRDGRVMVSDRQTGALVVFGADGQPAGVFDPKLPPAVAATGSVAPWRPLAAGFAPDGTLYVTDTSREHRVLVFGPDGLFRRELTGTAVGGLSYPNGVASLGRDVVVTDSNNARVLVFAPDGSVALEVKTGGLPRGIAVVAHERGSAVVSDLVVADTIGRKLVFFSSDGAPLGEAGRAGSGGGEFSFPTDVTAGSDGVVYVTDTGNRRVQMWSLGSGFVAAGSRGVAPAARPWWPYAAAAAAALVLVSGLVALGVHARRRRRKRGRAVVGPDERRDARPEHADEGPDEV